MRIIGNFWRSRLATSFYEKRYLFILLLFVAVAFQIERDSESALDAFGDAAVLDSQVGESTTFASCFIDPPTDSCHASTLAPTSSGGLFVAWYGGSREGAKDVQIYGATIDATGAVSPPFVILDRKRLARDARRMIRKLGNPVVYNQGGRLWLFVTSVSYGGWSGSSLNYAYSDDDGRTWSRFRRLRATPFFNLSALVRESAVPLTDGGFLLPAYCEQATKFGIALRFGSRGVMTGRVKTLIDGNRPALQPSILPLTRDRALGFFRVSDGLIGVSETTTGGRSWRPARAFPLGNPDSSVAVARLGRREAILVGNPSEDGRARLCVWKFDPENYDDPRLVLELENEPGGEFSYPFLAECGGRLYASYTYQRRRIRVVDLTDALRKAQTRATSARDESEAL